MGKKRHTARTGDKALYKSRFSNDEPVKKPNNDDDPMYDEVDRYNNARDELQENILRFDNEKKNDSSSDEEILNEESVFDLGVGGSSSESEEDDEDDNNEADTRDVEAMDSAETDNSSSDDDDDDDEFETPATKTDILNWGKTKKDYYHGDTADLEIGQEIEDAELEEDAGKEVMKARMEGMSEDDFILNTESVDECNADIDRKTKDTDEEVHAFGAEGQSRKRRNLVGLSKKDKTKLMKRSHPELLPLISHFRDGMIRPCVSETLVVNHALFQDKENIKAVGSSPSGLQYILGKAMLQTSTALNVCQYLLLKAEHAREGSAADISDERDTLFGSNDEDRIRNHPVIGRLKQLNILSDRIYEGVESKVKGLKPQIETLVKVSGMVTRDSSSDDNEPQTDTCDESVDAGETVKQGADEGEQAGEDQDTTDTSDDSSSDEDEDPTAIQRRLITEARFSVRSEDDEDAIELTDSIATDRRRRTLPSLSGCGDDDVADNQQDTIAARSLASTINSISQRSKSDTIQRRPAPEMEDGASDDEKVKRALDLMEADVGINNDSDGDEMDDAEKDYSQGEDDNNDFYSIIKKKSKQKKDYKKSKYAVAPKYPVFEEEIDAERPVGNMVMKNRGLVAHKAKINRNPRVKKREQYRKALIRRKGNVRDVRTDEGHKYGGETTGIKSNLSRSRKLT